MITAIRIALGLGEETTATPHQLPALKAEEPNNAPNPVAVIQKANRTAFENERFEKNAVATVSDAALIAARHAEKTAGFEERSKARFEKGAATLKKFFAGHEEELGLALNWWREVWDALPAEVSKVS